MEAVLGRFLALRYGPTEAGRIEQRWRANFGAAAGRPVGGDAVDGRHQEYEDLLALLLEHAAPPGEAVHAVARWIAFSCIGDRHLWEDLGLPERPVLTSLMADCFPGLRALNTRNMRWKKFLYKQLCERAEVFACRAPSCDQCSEFSTCFESRPVGMALSWVAYKSA